ncbi:cation-translocating P-type ATPase [Phytoactinopolyspora alkaliphila]|uniref:Cation-translocating P-type ATPase n=1 Tax=Phytoactinopolyspora alkaliphila TaxID=1783498 RepID=A0A6N9YNE8_9ACTN|nr:cation-translocating P-type ATPase [Phytoactinopolyspora alkaliphila]NED96566.1 cation-translocating P-type ATPase [Phytoactinopolyspora alkaliphila]
MLRAPGRLAGRAAMAGVSGAAFAAGVAKGTATSIPRLVSQSMHAESASREAMDAGRALTDLHPRRQHRRVWTGHGRAHIEVRGLEGDHGRRLAERVPAALRRVQGVRWAQINAVTGQVLVAFDERRLDVETLLNTVRAVEGDQGTREDDFSWRRPTHPGDMTAVVAVATELAADCVGSSAALVQSVLRLPPLPRWARAGMATLEIERDLRRGIKRRIGPIETDLVLTLANAAVHGLSQSVMTPAVDAVYRSTLLAEAWSRRQAWIRREPELSGAEDAVPSDAPSPPPRPGPRPKGPIEVWNDRIGRGAPAAAAGVLAFTRSPGRAADALLAAVPRPARYGREGFATAVGRDLARRGVVPLNAGAFRRLDRIDAVIIDSRVLITADGEIDPLADAVLDAARSTGATVALTSRAEAEELLPRVDHVLNGVPLADEVRRQQGDGHGVLVVTAADESALAAADVGVAVTRGEGNSYWSADVVCGEDLDDVWRILRATAAARGVSERAVRLAQAGSALGALHALVGDRRRGLARGFAPVQVAALVALISGTVSGLRATRGGSPRPVVHVPWHELPGTDVYTRLRAGRPGGGQDGAGTVEPPRRDRARSDARGLRARRWGEPARLAGAVFQELRDPLTPVLAGGAVASMIVGSGIDGVLVGAVMTGNALISGVQRVRVERALRGLLAEQEVQARRVLVESLDRIDDAPVEKTPARALMPGDVIELRTSDVVPADARLLRAAELEIDESTLTGESMPVAKDTEPTPGAPLAERTGMVFEGTTVLAGSAHAVVVAAGASTEAGRAARIAGHAPQPVGVQGRLHEVTRVALPMTALGGAAVAGIGLLRGMPLRQAVAAGVSVAVAAVPEGLPLVATVAQAGGARRLSRQNTLVRTSRALEALGRVDVVCFDKTGTLTEGRLSLTRLATPEGDVEPGGVDAARLLAAAARTCPQTDTQSIAKLAHATDRVVLEAAHEAGDVHRNGWQPVTELPFQAQRGYSAALGRIDGGSVLVVKGAPEVVLPLCGTDAGASGKAERLAGEGLRVLAVAQRRDGLPEDTDDLEPLVCELELLGFVGIADSARPEARDTVQAITGSGVRVVMVTGDHPETARATAAATGIANGAVVTGAELDRMSESERARKVAESTVFARVSPEQKVQIVAALQQAGRVVAMIGDGVNDAAAIRLADVGIGVRARGSTSAQSVADLVLPDADITQVHGALLEGRALWRRVRDAVSILVGGNAGEVGFMVIGTALAGRAPITTRQMLLVNMLTDMFPALAVALASGRNDEDDGKPVGAILGKPLAKAVAVRGAATALGATLAWTAGRWTGRRSRAGTMGLAALVATQLAQTLVIGRHSRLVVVTSVASFAALVAIIQTPGVSQFLGCTPLGPMAWGMVLAAAAAGTVVAVRRGSAAQ